MIASLADSTTERNRFSDSLGKRNPVDFRPGARGRDDHGRANRVRYLPRCHPTKAGRGSQRATRRRDEPQGKEPVAYSNGPYPDHIALGGDKRGHGARVDEPIDCPRPGAGPCSSGLRPPERGNASGGPYLHPACTLRREGSQRPHPRLRAEDERGVSRITNIINAQDLSDGRDIVFILAPKGNQSTDDRQQILFLD